MNSLLARFLVGLAAVALARGEACVLATDWTGAELAWRNDPRPAADAPLPVEPPPARRTTRRAQRRTMRRVDLDPEAAVPTATPTAAPPSETVIRRPEIESLPLEPAPLSTPRVIVHRDQASGDHPRQRFDLYLPDGCSGGGLPLVIWIHGPDWRTGSKADCPLTWLVGQGFAVASVEYRPSDVAVFPAQLDDCRAAVDAIRADAATWGIDLSRICVAGMGGGGHLAALVAFSPLQPVVIREASTDDAVRESSLDIAAVAIFDGPTHLPSLGGHHDRAGSAASRLVGGPLPEFREAAQRASPLTHVSADDPPTLVVHGTRGDAVPVEQGSRLDAALRAADVESRLVILNVAGSGLEPREDTPAGNALVEFLDHTLGGRSPVRGD